MLHITGTDVSTAVGIYAGSEEVPLMGGSVDARTWTLECYREVPSAAEPATRRHRSGSCPVQDSRYAILNAPRAHRRLADYTAKWPLPSEEEPQGVGIFSELATIRELAVDR
jgi:hypothetical protein